MAQALYFKLSYERYKTQINKIAPDLDVALLDEEGNILHENKIVSLADIEPEYFWLPVEIFHTSLLQTYFQIMQESPSVRWLHTVNAGMDQLPYLSLLRKNVCITNSHTQAISIAEYVMGQVLNICQDIIGLRNKQLDKIWEYRLFREIYNSHWLIIGFGHIGQEIAKRAKAFGVRISAVRRSSEDAGLADQILRLEDIHQVIPSADVIVLACTSNSQTRNLVNMDFLSRMKSNAILVNVARGDLLIEDDLRKALDQGLLGYAILDVFRDEPPAGDSWVWLHKNITLTPHTSNAGSGMKERTVDLFLENLDRMVNGRNLLNIVSEKDII